MNRFLEWKIFPNQGDWHDQETLIHFHYEQAMDIQKHPENTLHGSTLVLYIA